MTSLRLKFACELFLISRCKAFQFLKSNVPKCLMASSRTQFDPIFLMKLLLNKLNIEESLYVDVRRSRLLQIFRSQRM